MFYISGSSVRTSVDFLTSMVGVRSRLVKTEKLMANKALSFLGQNVIIFNLIASRQVLNSLTRVSGESFWQVKF